MRALCLLLVVVAATLQPGAAQRTEAAKAPALSHPQGSSTLQSTSAASLPTAVHTPARPPQASSPLDLTGTAVSGKLQEGDIATAINKYDPASGRVPAAGFGNSEGPNNVPVTQALTEFGNFFEDGQGGTYSLPTDIQESGIITVKIRATGIFATTWTWETWTITLKSPAFRGVTGYEVLQESFGVFPPTTVLPAGGDTLVITIPAGSVGTFPGFPTDYTYRIQLTSVCSGSSSACCENNVLAPSTKVCRVSNSPCRLDATCNGVDDSCPANPPGNNYEACPWYPATPHTYYTEYSSLARFQPTPEEATLLAAAAPTYDTGDYWPTCMGNCIDGFCALRMDHPTCCVARKADEVSDTAASTTSMGRWYGTELYCWK